MTPGDLLNKLKQTFFEGQSDQPVKKRSKFQMLILLLAVGVGMMILSEFFTSGGGQENSADVVPVSQTPSDDQASSAMNHSSQSKEKESMEAYASDLEDQLEDFLKKIQGVSDVDVMVWLGSSKKSIYEKDEDSSQQKTVETDNDGGERTIKEQQNNGQVVFKDGKNGKQPILVTKESPEISGVAVVADGADNKLVRTWIINTVTSVLRVPSYNVEVTPGKSKEE
ncbi:stage III sporulation protein AG [Tuberibacillus sp. Marseille-P3662]|uniref:stage III sporulation protein AG n=1 Tax=Tuberibacillus sp. Marseille-P3662 TaxID=1965358 RepID=UPI000A1C7A7A|nr:stage III sporulation protein AG [Tuberibacillus sp. Marseille-P3662]